MIKELEKYAEAIGANDEVLSWLRTTGRKSYAKAFASLRDLSGEIEHILDFLVSPAAPRRLQKMSYADAKKKAGEWSKANQKKGRHLVDNDGDIETIHDFLDGTKIVRLKTKKAFQREGFFMGHCVGGYDPDNKGQQIYSYRDGDNEPHATFEVKKEDNEIIQIKGKGNGPIHPKYIHPILSFLKSIGMDVRPNDMINLGYYHIHGDYLEFLSGYPEAKKQITMINGAAYAF